MSRTRNQTLNNENEFSYPTYVEENFPQPAPYSSWMNMAVGSQAHYGGTYFPYLPRPQLPNVPPVATQIVSENATASTSNVNSTVVVSNSNPDSNLVASNSAPTSTNNGAKGNAASTKWREEQTTVLVHEWKERIEELESSRATETWRQIVNAVNKAGSPKSVQQCKNKIRNLKQKYKEAKANNKHTGRSPKTSPFYDSFDEVLGTRAVVTMPGVIQSDSVPSSETTLNDSEEESDESESDSSTTPSPEQGAKRKKLPQKPARKPKNGRITAATAMVDLTEKLVELQRSQMEMMKSAQSRAEELLVKMETDQRRLDEESRRRDQEFFLRMAELLKK